MSKTSSKKRKRDDQGSGLPGIQKEMADVAAAVTTTSNGGEETSSVSTSSRKKKKLRKRRHQEKANKSHPGPKGEEDGTNGTTGNKTSTAKPNKEYPPSEKWSKSKKKRMRKRRAAVQFQETKEQQKTTHPLNSGDDGTRPTTNEDKTSRLIHSFQTRLAGSRFRVLNEELYTTTSKSAFHRFSQQPELFEQYHEGFRQQVKQWPVNPLDLIIKSIKAKAFHFHSNTDTTTITIADFGCGDAELAKQLLAFQDQKDSHHRHCPLFQVHSFDLVATSELVTACDMAHTPLPKASVDVAVFCLALMGTNLADFIREAHRVLKDTGRLKIAEVRSRFQRKGGGPSSATGGGAGDAANNDDDDVDDFLQVLEQLGFECISQDKSNKMFIVLELRKNGRPPNLKTDRWCLKPCIYKRR